MSQRYHACSLVEYLGGSHVLGKPGIAFRDAKFVLKTIHCAGRTRHRSLRGVQCGAAPVCWSEGVANLTWPQDKVRQDETGRTFSGPHSCTVATNCLDTASQKTTKMKFLSLMGDCKDIWPSYNEGGNKVKADGERSFTSTVLTMSSVTTARTTAKVKVPISQMRFMTLDVHAFTSPITVTPAYHLACFPCLHCEYTECSSLEALTTTLLIYRSIRNRGDCCHTWV